MGNRFEALRGFRPGHPWFIGLDSDGCVFDGMELKHKECFCPAYIKHFRLQAASSMARQVWEFVNLYSRSRGTNRFGALILALDMLERRPEVADRGVRVPRLEGLRRWLARERQLGLPALAAEAQRTGDPDLARVLAWTMEVNQRIAETCHGVPPFPSARRAIERATGQADLMVVSQASADALQREWDEHGLTRHVRLLAGQEMGSKTDHLRYACGDKYAPGHVLLCGDAPGDREAAEENGRLFFPIIPGREEESWRRFVAEGLERFLAGRFAGEYQQALLIEFGAALADRPPWPMGER